ncbi:helix-turn-helix transcriptional regulator [Curvibacter sp. APW13]|uniref:helix-turn-helix domain-containing protein n=1 Tax=Curvibacter sp. APW13 TaxID=3077236 RepID=UPI0028E01694|nr:helix-turn-helix transcriptional regulator [Curvibacter sp. APW13]MDT8992823.1 helix-turn-helix transcriptional regulator [Curvibacter sp. APW13]
MRKTTKNKSSFAQALRGARQFRGMSQEDFSVHSSRTYVSTLERGLKSPTLSKVDQLADCLEMQPLTLLAMAYSSSLDELDELLDSVRAECAGFGRPWG